jgi:hypothetical protein
VSSLAKRAATDAQGLRHLRRASAARALGFTRPRAMSPMRRSCTAADSETILSASALAMLIGQAPTATMADRSRGVNCQHFGVSPAIAQG